MQLNLNILNDVSFALLLEANPNSVKHSPLIFYFCRTKGKQRALQWTFILITLCYW